MIHIIQLLCPQRHCFCAVAWDDREIDLGSAYIRLGMATAELHMAGHPLVCALCGATSFHHEDGVTRFETMEAARPHLEACLAAQLATRRMITETERN